MLAEAMTLETFLTTLGSIVTAFIGYAVDILGVITSNPILLVGIGVITTFTAIKLIKKIF